MIIGMMKIMCNNGMTGIRRGVSVLGRGIMRGGLVVTGISSEVVGADLGGVLY
jgi:hypothetical protein